VVGQAQDVDALCGQGPGEVDALGQRDLYLGFVPEHLGDLVERRILFRCKGILCRIEGDVFEILVAAREEREGCRHHLEQHVADGFQHDLAVGELRGVEVAAHREVHLHVPFFVSEHVEPQFERDVHFGFQLLALLVHLGLEGVEVVRAVEIAVADDVLTAEGEVAARDGIGREVFAVGREIFQAEVRQRKRDVLVVQVVERSLPAEFCRPGALHPGVDLQVVALRWVEIAAPHADFADDVFERFGHRQVAERDLAAGDLQIGDLQHRGSSRTGFRGRFDGLFRTFGRGFHQRRDVVALGRQLGIQGESPDVEPLETEAHPAQVALGEFHAQRIDSGYGLLAHVLQCELRKRGRAFGAQGQQVLGVAPQPHVGREAPFDGPDVEPLADVGKHACQHQPVEFQPDVELRGVDVVGDARGQRTALGEVQHGAHVGLLAAEVDARNLQVDVVEPPHGIEFQILVEKVSVADGDVVDADLPRFGGFCGFRNGRGVRCEVRDDVVEAERVALLVDLHVETCEGDVLHRDAIRQQRQDAHAHIETVEREKGRRVVAAADL